MARLTEEMVVARSKQSDLAAVKKLNCWGAELRDVSLLRHMPNVEVIAFSVNKIRTLADFVHCQQLRELYIRKNEIADLAEIRHLRGLPSLAELWLEENPCTSQQEYRHTVLRHLPRLTKLDNVPVDPLEVQEAQRRGLTFPESDDEEYIPQESPRRSPSPDQEPDPEVYYREEEQQPSVWQEEVPEQPPETPPCNTWRRSVRSPECEDSMTRSCYERAGGAGGAGASSSRVDEAALRHSFSAQSVKEYAASNGDHHHRQQYYGDTYTDRQEYAAPPPARPPSDTWERGERGERGEPAPRDRDREYKSAVMAEHTRPGFKRRPVTRSSNLLSAVLCLVKELDYQSLEVAEMAVRCRMDELANGP